MRIVHPSVVRGEETLAGFRVDHHQCDAGHGLAIFLQVLLQSIDVVFFEETGLVLGAAVVEDDNLPEGTGVFLGAVGDSLQG